MERSGHPALPSLPLSVSALWRTTQRGCQYITPRAKKVLELALREALSLGHNYVGTEHILLGLMRENEGAAARILLGFDADSEKIRNEVIRTLSTSSPRQDADTMRPARRRRRRRERRDHQ